MARKSHSFRLVNPRKGTLEGVLKFFGGSAKKAEDKARRFANRHGIPFDSGRRKNVEGYMEDGVFHPIRWDTEKYDPSRLGRDRRRKRTRRPGKKQRRRR